MVILTISPTKSVWQGISYKVFFK